MDIEFTVKAAQLFSAGLCMGLGAIGTALGIGYIGGYANTAVSRREGMSSQLVRSMLIAQAVTETAAIFSLVVSILLVFINFSGNGICACAAVIGAGIAMGAGALGSGIGSGFPGAEAILATSRQPNGEGMTTLMLIGQAVCQTPAIFALVISFMLMFRNCSGIDPWPYSACLIGAGIAIGFGAIGSGWSGG